jgi:hypothetical protein
MPVRRYDESALAGCGKDRSAPTIDGARPEVLVTEFLLPDTDGVALACVLRTTIPNLAVLILTTGASPLPEGLTSNRISVLDKPFTACCLQKAVLALMGDATPKVLASGS